MILKHAFFLSFSDEKKWLEQQNAKGLELVRATPATYYFEKTDAPVSYEYIPLQKGRRSFAALDYKKKDKDVKAVYGTAEMALFKKPRERGEPDWMPHSQKKLLFAKYRVTVWVRALVLLSLFAMFGMLAARLQKPLVYLPGAAMLLLSLWQFYQTFQLDAYIKKNL